MAPVATRPWRWATVAPHPLRSTVARPPVSILRRCCGRGAEAATTDGDSVRPCIRHKRGGGGVIRPGQLHITPAGEYTECVASSNTCAVLVGVGIMIPRDVRIPISDLTPVLPFCVRRGGPCWHAYLILSYNSYAGIGTPHQMSKPDRGGHGRRLCLWGGGLSVLLGGSGNPKQPPGSCGCVELRCVLLRELHMGKHTR